MAPCADNKITGDVDDDVLRMRTRLLKVQIPCLVGTGCSPIKDICSTGDEVTSSRTLRNLNHIRINADLINTPALGDDENIAYTATQLNIAPAEVRESGELNNL
jgi:hypothetical protein